MSAATCSCASRVTTWADGFGIWHAVVPATADAVSVARRAIRLELTARGDMSPSYRLTVEYVAPRAACHVARVEYSERVTA